MIEVHLYGRLRRHAKQTRATADSVLSVPHEQGDTIRSVVQRAGISVLELGSNLFVNGRYASLSTRVPDRARLGLFPRDMQLLYKWYFTQNSGVTAPKLSDGQSNAASEGRIPHAGGET